jgi:hypothetical protein
MAIGLSCYDVLCEETNRHYQLSLLNYKISAKDLKWTDMTRSEVKKFVEIIVLMGKMEKYRKRLLFHRKIPVYQIDG